MTATAEPRAGAHRPGADAATVSVGEYLSAMWRQRVTVLLVLVAVVGGTWATTRVMSRTYVASAEVYISVGTGPQARDLSRGFAYAQGLARSYARIATLPVVLGPVSTQLGVPSGVEELQRKVEVRAPADTVLIEITAKDSDRRQAAAIANAVADRLHVVIDQLSPPRPGGLTSYTLSTVSPATVPRFATSPRVGLSMTIAALLGLVAALVAAVVVDDRRGLGGSRRLRALTAAPVLGTVVRRRWPWVGERRRAEQARLLRVGFERMHATRRPRSVVLTSTRGGRAFADSLSQLAASLSWAHDGVLLVDADLRGRDLTHLYGLDGRPGLTDVLLDPGTWRDATRPGPRDGVSVLPAGRPTDEHPATLLGTPANAQLLADLRETFGLVLVAAPSVRDVADGLLLADLTDGVVVVADERRTTRTELLAELDAVRLVGSTVLGVVLTR